MPRFSAFKKSAVESIEMEVQGAESPREGSMDKSASDDGQLQRLGKKPVLKRSFGFMSILGFSCTVLITWEGSVVVATNSLLNGGPAGVLWGFLVCWTGTFSTFLTIAELASLAPISGGQYHWISLLSPPSMRKFLSYITGWVTVIGWQAINVSNGFLIATIIQSIAVMCNPTYVPTRWQSMLLTWAILAVAVVVNTISSRALAQFEGVILVLHLMGFFGVLIPLVYFGPHGDASVFTTMFNGGGWDSNALSFLVGLPSLIFSLFGADSAVHMSEEIINASVAVPQAIVFTMLINGALGFSMLLALMFCMGSFDDALSYVELGSYPYLEIFQQAVGSAGGAAAMSSTIVVLGIFATVGTVAASTRLLWAFARDRGVPFSAAMAKVNSRTTLPINTIFTTIVVSMLLSLIALGSTIALNDVLSLSIAGLYSSYLICCAMLLYRRLKGQVGERDDRCAVTGPENLRWGPWRVPEPLGTINNAFACVYLVWMLFWSFWPPAQSVTPSTMNFSVLVFWSVVIFSVIWYVLRAHKYYQGPIIELGVN